MYLKTVTASTSQVPNSQWLGLSEVDFKNKKSAFSFLYVGNDKGALQNLFNSFHQGAAVENYRMVREYLTAADELPDVICIDIPFNYYELKQFHGYLRSERLEAETLLIYNARQLPDYGQSVSEVLSFVDDIIDLGSDRINYSQKVSFLRKSKTLYHSMHKKSSYATGKKKLKDTSYILKRVVDILLATLIILLILPVFIIIALAIKIESKGPVIYTSLRAGRGFKVFRFFKFRTMEMDADKKVDALLHLNQYEISNSGPRFFKVQNDPRITRVGKFLRNTSLDELPQLINVLLGDMSLVGNRPLPLYEASTLTTNAFVERFMAPAGMTGLWQIKKRGNANMSVEERVELDISYARKNNLLYDFWIMANTPKALFQKSDV